MKTWPNFIILNLTLDPGCGRIACWLYIYLSKFWLKLNSVRTSPIRLKALPQIATQKFLHCTLTLTLAPALPLALAGCQLARAVVRKVSRAFSKYLDCVICNAAPK